MVRYPCTPQTDCAREGQARCTAVESMPTERSASRLPLLTSAQLSRMPDRVSGARVSIKWLLGELASAPSASPF